MTGITRAKGRTGSFDGTLGHRLATTLPVAEKRIDHETQVDRQQVIACRLRGSLNALILSLHVLEQHANEPQALEFSGHVAQAAKQINALTRRLYATDAGDDVVPASRARPPRLRLSGVTS